VKRIGITGHQGLDPHTETLVEAALAAEISARGPVSGITSLAEGADQIFAKKILGRDGTLLAVIPSAGYEGTFQTSQALDNYRFLKSRSTEIIEMPFAQPTEEAYWAAGRKVVDLADEMLAVWDGEKSGGLGGTGDVVAFAREQGVPVTVIWPAGSSRA
jgi:hypothetical protein